ncbi:MAG TPA: cupin domain-containing protein [Candidatus Angelobacter sp.]|nr:cupin domain-containing protein [Candidatus Angelobacter sp.]
MHKLLAMLVLVAASPLAQTPGNPGDPVAVTVITPDKINWKPAPANMPPGAKVAVLSGDPASDGPFILRLKLPDGYKIPPHWHPVTEYTTVLSGQLFIGAGDVFDESKLQALPQRSVVAVPAHQNHYALAKGETEVQTQGMGPFKRTYVNPADDPSRK